MTVVKELIKNEGAGALFKGLTPKVRVRPVTNVSPVYRRLFHFPLDPRCRAQTGVQLYAGADPHPVVL